MDAGHAGTHLTALLEGILERRGVVEEDAEGLVGLMQRTFSGQDTASSPARSRPKARPGRQTAAEEEATTRQAP